MMVWMCGQNMAYFRYLALFLYSIVINTFVSKTPAMKPPICAVKAIEIAVIEPIKANTI